MWKNPSECSVTVYRASEAGLYENERMCVARTIIAGCCCEREVVCGDPEEGSATTPAIARPIVHK